MFESKPFFLSFNKNLILKNKWYFSLILIFGLLDIITTYLGLTYFNLIEVNSFSIINNIPFSVIIWVLFYIFTIYIIDSFISQIKITKSSEVTFIKIMGYYKIFIIFISMYAPLYNFMLIYGVGLI
jgi:hypothetical protein